MHKILIDAKVTLGQQPPRPHGPAPPKLHIGTVAGRNTGDEIATSRILVTHFRLLSTRALTALWRCYRLGSEQPFPQLARESLSWWSPRYYETDKDNVQAIVGPSDKED